MRLRRERMTPFLSRHIAAPASKLLALMLLLSLLLNGCGPGGGCAYSFPLLASSPASLGSVRRPLARRPLPPSARPRACCVVPSVLFAAPLDDVSDEDEAALYSQPTLPTRTRTGVISPLESDGGDDEDNGGSSSGSGGGVVEGLRRKMFAEVEKMRQQFEHLTDSLSAAEERASEAAEAERRLREDQERERTAGERNIAGAKKVFSDEMNDLADQLESAQDALRRTANETRTNVSAVRSKAKEKQIRLENEISDLESRLASIRKEAVSAEAKRGEVARKINDEVREAESRKAMDDERKASFARRKVLTRKSWAAETRVDRAEMDLIPGEQELERAKATGAERDSLRGVLKNLRSYLNPQVEELEERKKSQEMLFASSVKKSKEGLERKLAEGKADFEEAEGEEKERLDQTVADYEARLTDDGREWSKKLRLAKERSERDLVDAILNAKKECIAIYEDKYRSLKSEDAQRDDTILEAEYTRVATKERYDAEYENELHNVDLARVDAKRGLIEKDLRIEKEKLRLTDKKDRVVAELAEQLKEERAVREEELRRTKDAKSATLALSRARTIKAKNDVIGAKSDLALARGELELFERKLMEKDRALRRLEGERSSFRMQARRTLTLAGERLTFKKWRVRRRRKE